jgi:hypothetical protein
METFSSPITTLRAKARLEKNIKKCAKDISHIIDPQRHIKLNPAKYKIWCGKSQANDIPPMRINNARLTEVLLEITIPVNNDITTNIKHKGLK